MYEDKDYEYNKRRKIGVFFVLILFFTVFFIFTLFGIKKSDKPIPKLVNEKKIDFGVRGSIKTQNGFTLASSKVLFRVIVYKKYLDPNKKEAFLTLFSKYTGIDPEVLEKKLLEGNNRVVLSKDVTFDKAKFLKDLKYDLRRIGVFKPLENSKNKEFYQDIDIEKFMEMRIYPFKDLLSPYLGFVRYDKNDEPYAHYGLEGYYNDFLKDNKDAILSGQRDKRGVIIRDKKNKVIKKQNGYDIITNVDVKLQRAIERILDEQKQKLKAKEIIAAIMEPKSGKIIAFASSRRYNPGKIRLKDINILTISAIAHIFEPGSVIKPIFFSILYENNQVSLNEIVNTHNGYYRLSKKYVITDEHKEAFLSAKNVIVYSSNIGMAELSKRANPMEVVDGFLRFGFSKKSGIDLAQESSGSIPPIEKLRNSVVRANFSYGYSIGANFVQLLKAYNVFNNDGKSITPRIASYKINLEGKKELIEVVKPKRVLSKRTANVMKKILIDVVKKGTATATNIPGLQIGGKTGTAEVFSKKSYTKTYNSSFFGFANDYYGHKYTIGVLVIEPDPNSNVRFASHSAVPTFRRIVETLVDRSFLQIK